MVYRIFYSVGGVLRRRRYKERASYMHAMIQLRANPRVTLHHFGANRVFGPLRAFKHYTV